MNAPLSPPVMESIAIPARDGFPLAARLFVPAGQPLATLIVAGATGVPQGFYRRFAQFAAERGFRVVTFDYRGIGESAVADLAKLDASFTDWARLDLAAIVVAFHQDDLPLHLVGHSFGGHALGFLPNHDKVSKLLGCGVGAGWHGWMPKGESRKVWLIWNVVLPPLVKWYGYAPMKRLGVGENLPTGVYRQWRRWCSFRHYLFDDPRAKQEAQGFSEVKTAILAVNALDDLWAQPASRQAFIQGYRQAPRLTLDLTPADFGVAIGHMGYFRAECQPLWDEALNWLHPQSPAAPKNAQHFVKVD